MAKKSKLKAAAVTIGTAAGKVDATAHKAAKAAHVAKQELIELGKQVDLLKKQLKKSTDRLKSALK